jgi:serine/threonine protein kinase
MGVCIQPAELLLVSELIEGGSLETVIYDTEKKLDDIAKQNLSVQCAKGIAYRHSIDPPVVHMDIKPQNILVTKALEVKICYFGLARSRKQMISTTSLHPSQHIGTPYYMDPELLLNLAGGGEECENKCCDIWSMGATLLELYIQKDIWFPEEEEEDDNFDALDTIKKMMENKTEPPTLKTLTGLAARWLRPCLSYRPNTSSTAARTT